MNIKKHITNFLLVFGLMAETCNGQFITIPDPVFASVLAAKYPTVVTGNQLDTNASKTITGLVDIRLKNINDITGIEYFNNITKLYISQNNLTFLPPLNRLKNLTMFWLDSNQLTTIPDFRMMTNLKDMRCRNNQLTSLPSMDGLSNLTLFFCNSNQLTSLPSMVGLTSLDHFICSDNFLSSLPDMSTHIVLRRFLCSGNLFTSVDLTGIPNVKEVHFKYNKLKSFPVVTGMTQLTELQLQYNYIDSLPDLSSFVNLSLFNISNNNLTFEDLLPLSSNPNVASFIIGPQHKVGTSSALIKKTGTSFQFKLNVDNLVPSNQYAWYKDGQLLTTTTTNSFNIPTLQLSDNGSYTCTITNPTVPFDTIHLYVNPLNLQVIECMDISHVKPVLGSDKCNVPVPVTINENVIYGATPPYTYSLRNVILNSSVSYNASPFSVAQEGTFDLIVTDAAGCSDTLTNAIILSRPADCDPIFYPDLTGMESTYYIETKGTAKIYSTSGTKIRDLVTPAYWDGKNNAGELMDTGLYVIIVNDEQKIPISLRRTN